MIVLIWPNIRYVIIIILAFTISCCEKEEATVSDLSGIWIELVNGNDTIDFDSWSSEDVFVLRRGFELRNGYSLPKYGSGPYKFFLRSDSIMINYMLSGCGGFVSYSFHMNSSMFEIGNFYDMNLASNQRIKFYKVQ